MLPTVTVWGIRLELTLLLLLAYLLALWVGGWGLEILARAHFRRAQRHAHAGFDFDAGLDRYECPQGEWLTLHTLDDREKLAIYKAPARSCNACVLKPFCTSHDEGRHIYRSLSAFHETDIGRFHRRLSLIILAMALAFSVGGVVAWWNTPGEWPLLIAACVSLVLLWLDIRDAPGSIHGGTDSEVESERKKGTGTRAAS
jgi:hypothetical protein